MTIYLDVLFVKELVADFIVILFSYKVLGIKINIKKMFIGAAIGVTYSIICVLFYSPLLAYGRLIIAILIVLTSYKIRSQKEFFKILITFYMVTFCVSGISFYAYSSYGKRLIFLVSIYIIISDLIKKYMKSYRLANYMMNLEFRLGNEKLHLKTFIDTGHNLVSEFDENVIVVTPSIMQRILSAQIEKEYRNIFFKSLGNSKGKSLGVKLENIVFKYGDKTGFKDGVVISAESELDGYDAMVGLKFLEENKPVVKKEESNGNFIYN